MTYISCAKNLKILRNCLIISCWEYGIKPWILAKWVHFRLFSAFSAITSMVEMLQQSPYNKLAEIPWMVALIPINLTANIWTNIVNLSDSIAWYYMVFVNISWNGKLTKTKTCNWKHTRHIQVYSLSKAMILIQHYTRKRSYLRVSQAFPLS